MEDKRQKKKKKRRTKPGGPDRLPVGPGAEQPEAPRQDARPKREAKKEEAKPKATPRAEPKPPRQPMTRLDQVRLIGGIAAMAIGFPATFLLMAYEEHTAFGPLWGMITLFVGVGGLLAFVGRGASSEIVSLRKTALFDVEGELVVLSPIVTVPVALLILLIGFAVGGFPGLPVTIAFALAPLFLSSLKRPGLLVFVVASYLLLPLLGAYGLWDPWETHYGEVAREILSRDDWISLWWAQEDWFWSKPILIFWLEALSMGAGGVDFHPDANPLHPEWAIRLPHFLLTVGALLSVYALVSKVVSKRAGVVCAIVLATMPHFFFLAHQAITDMPFVSTMTMAMAMLGLAICEDPKREVKRYAIGPLLLSAQHLVIGALGVIAIPQALYLISRNVMLMKAFVQGDGGAPFGWHADMFVSGSAGNHGVPGNSPVHNVEPFLNGVAAQPMVQGLIWLLGLGLLMFFLWRERRARSLYIVAFYVFCGLSFMGKGIPGFALPGLVALLFLFGARRWDLLLEGHLRVGLGALIVTVVGLPWYVAMYVRHGPPFTDRLLVHDHINRLTAGVHGDTGSIEYFVEQMGYGLFPWIALAPLALAAWVDIGSRLTAKTPRAAMRRQILTFVALWFAAAFTLFSAMTTKFHHYIFPAVPAAAILVGVALDRLLGPPPDPGSKLSRALAVLGTVLAVLSPVPAIIGVAGIWGDVRGILPAEVIDTPSATDWVLAHPWASSFCAVLIAIGVMLLAGAVALLKQTARPNPKPAPSWRPAAMTTGLLAAPVLVGLVGRDLSWVTDARPQGYERLIHLFVYNYGRPWPEHFDYRPILTGFAIVATIVVMLAAIPQLRAAASRAFIGVALAFAFWSLDVYMIDLTPHWGQRELVQEYYASRANENEPLVAWQMNWKGENFYTGNHVSVFVQLDNRQLNEWLAQRPPGSTVFFMLEHGRLSSLRGILRNATVEPLTNERDCNKFVLVRARLGQQGPAQRQTLD